MFSTNGREEESCIANRTGSIEAKLSFIDHPPDKKIYGEDIKYEQALVEYLIFLNQVVQKEESAQEQNAVVPNERVEQMLQYISKNLSHPLSLEEMEKQFLSANTISHENLKSTLDLRFISM